MLEGIRHNAEYSGCKGNIVKPTMVAATHIMAIVKDFVGFALNVGFK